MKIITLTEYLKQHHTTQTAAAYNYTITHFLKLHPKAKRYKYQQLVNYFAEVNQQYQNIQTRIKILSAIKRYYSYLVFTEQREDHPCKTLTMKKGSSQAIQLQDLFSSSELEQLTQRENRYKLLESRNKILLGLLIYQGLTSDEIIRLDVDNIDLDIGTIDIKGSKKLNRRTLTLQGNQIQPLYRYINETRPAMQMVKTDKLILNKLGKPITVDGISAMIEPLNVLFPDRPLHPRSIRMSVISNWLNEKKLPLEHVQELAGHKWPSTTEKYIKMDTLKQRELINKFFPL
ncbi:tyrosine-type recombinase/integrase [Flavobacterium zepuense]|uniref:Tyrosine-type recombinase/integrase n=1 Tax=Flavobacterium zepuense TaxID=2593302 RepID=A0A552UTA3_9FLAO|nr:site-specific integrase [Flavobacterium zepuense]TRW21461.1 tyrosine-type recombinase/integrase [Flavobacterium zepuense]